MRLIWAPHVVYCISQGSYRTTLYLGRGGIQDQDARVRHARYVCRSYSQKYRYTKNRPIGVTVVFANGIYTPSAHDARVRLGLVALPFPSRASFDKIPGRYSIRRAVIKDVARGPFRQSVGSKNLIGRIVELKTHFTACSKKRKYVRTGYHHAPPLPLWPAPLLLAPPPPPPSSLSLLRLSRLLC